MRTEHEIKHRKMTTEQRISFRARATRCDHARGVRMCSSLGP